MAGLCCAEVLLAVSLFLTARCGCMRRLVAMCVSFTWVRCSRKLTGADVGVNAVLILVLVLVLMLIFSGCFVMLRGPDATLVTTLEGRILPLRSWFQVKTRCSALTSAVYIHPGPSLFLCHAFWPACAISPIPP
jgi:hypothetical protein